TLWDPITKVGGLAHVMLPYASPNHQNNPPKYADTAIPMLVESMKSNGAAVNRLVAKLAGGAQMFQFAHETEWMRIGPRNVEAVHEALLKLQIPVIAEQTGSNFGRTIEFCTSDGVLVIRTAKQGEQRI
ncbi:MAG: chemotaxis protein CheD, partial [Bacilli bacterium]|nr:chemotaxis protein CheD [Bacilli bacterium]